MHAPVLRKSEDLLIILYRPFISLLPFSSSACFPFFYFRPLHFRAAQENMSNPNPPTLRWGIVATGAISSAFVKDLVLPRADAKARHIITAIGSSSLSKGLAFVSKNLPDISPAPRVYEGYQAVYTDSDVDIVYIGTPHSFHKQNCLDAIHAGKHVLCEKPFTLNARDAREVFALAEEKHVFVMEAMWTRFFSLTQSLQRLLHEDKVIGEVLRVFADFSSDHKLAEKGPESRLKNPALGAGSLLNLGVYSLTWALLALDQRIGGEAEKLAIKCVQTIQDGIDVASTVVVLAPSTGRQGICTSSSCFKSPGKEFCRIEGTKGHIVVEGSFASRPGSFTIFTQDTAGSSEKKYEFSIPGGGFYWEADAVAQDIAAGKMQNERMPWAETIRVMEIVDTARRQGGAKFPGED